MPLQGILSTARSLTYYLRRQEVTANNLANANTDAFKADRLTARMQVDHDHAVSVQTTDLQQGAFRETGRPLDVGLSGPGFLVVRTAQGDRLFRGGSLEIDPSGRLVDDHANLVMGDQGPLVIEGSDVTFQADGTIEVDGTIAGRLRLVDPEDPSALRKEGFGRFIAGGPVQPVTEGSVRVRQGAIEQANLDPIVSMVDLVAIQRAYAANIDALRAMDGVLNVVANDVGKI
jgi:flagellar basal-body rod protein FlgF